MSDEVSLGDRKYVSSKRASELSGYAQDYIGQLSRKGLIDAERVGGLWYVSMESLQNYKEHAESYTPQPPERKPVQDPESLVSFDGRDHISAARASKITGYHQDYVGQLARSGAIASRQVGNRWYIDREALLAHKSAKDGLLGAVQSQSVGITKPESHITENVAPKSNSFDLGPHLTYTRDDRDLLPVLGLSGEEKAPEKEIAPVEEEPHVVPIHVVHTHSKEYRLSRGSKPSLRTDVVHTKPKKAMFYSTLAATAATIVIVLSFGIATIKNDSLYAAVGENTSVSSVKGSLTASAAHIYESLLEVIQHFLASEEVYQRKD